MKKPSSSDKKTPINKYGLTRYIPSDVSYQIRKNSGFGCVICGVGITDYEHVDPEFADAHKHDANAMCLLCPSCHRKKGGFTSVNRIKAAMRNPKCKEAGFVHDSFYLDEWPQFVAGKSRFVACQNILTVGGKPLITVNHPDSIEGPYTITAIFQDPDGLYSLVIDRNRWYSPLDNWDLIVTKRSIKVVDRTGKVNLELVFYKDSVIHIKQLNMMYEGYHILMDKNEIKIKKPTGASISFQGIDFMFHTFDAPINL